MIQRLSFIMKFMDALESNITIATSLVCGVRIVLYVIGLLINIRVISVCWRSRENIKTWQLHILYSLVCTIHFCFIIPFSLISNTIPHLSRYAGEGACYFSSLTIMFDTWIIHINSLMIALVKYIFIVHWDSALLFGHTKIQWIVLAISIAIPIYIAVVNTLLKDFGVFKILKSCFGSQNFETDENIEIKTYSLCSMEKEKFGYAAQVVLQIVCVSTKILSFLISTNMGEAFFYYKTFKKMKRFGVYNWYLLVRIKHHLKCLSNYFC